MLKPQISGKYSDKEQGFKFFLSQTTSLRLERSSSNAENSFVNNFKIADYF